MIRALLLVATLGGFAVWPVTNFLLPPTVSAATLTTTQTTAAYRYAIRAIALEGDNLAGTCEDDYDAGADCDAWLSDTFPDLRTASLVPVYTASFRGLRWHCGYDICSAGWQRGVGLTVNP